VYGVKTSGKIVTEDEFEFVSERNFSYYVNGGAMRSNFLYFCPK